MVTFALPSLLRTLADGLAVFNGWLPNQMLIVPLFYCGIYILNLILHQLPNRYITNPPCARPSIKAPNVTEPSAEPVQTEKLTFLNVSQAFNDFVTHLLSTWCVEDGWRALVALPGPIKVHSTFMSCRHGGCGILRWKYFILMNPVSLTSRHDLDTEIKGMQLSPVWKRYTY